MRAKLLLAVNAPSLTVTVMLAIPDWSGRGVTVIVRFEPEPPKTMFSSETSAGFDEAALRMRAAAGVSASPTANEMGPKVPLTDIAPSAICEIVGLSLWL